MFKLRLITTKLITSNKIIKNFKIGKVFFEKHKPKNDVFGFVSMSSGSIAIGSAIKISNSYKVVIGNGESSVGGYDISGGNKDIIILISKKPNFLRKNMVKLFFGWNWVNSKKI